MAAWLTPSERPLPNSGLLSNNQTLIFQQMTRLFLLLFTFIITLQTTASAMEVSGPEPRFLHVTGTCSTGPMEDLDASRYQMHITVSDARGKRQLRHFIESETVLGIMDADLSFWTGIKSRDAADETFCTISITVTVRIGFDSNFVEASGSVEGIPCDDVVNAIRRLRDQLMAGIQ